VKQKRFNVEQIVAVLKQAEAGVPLAELLRRVGVSQQTFYRWKKQYVSGSRPSSAAEAASRREYSSEATGRRPDPRQSHAAGRFIKKIPGPSRCRQVVEYLHGSYRVSERRACRIARMNRATFRYRSYRDPRKELRMRIREIAQARVRYGYRKIRVLLNREGWKMGKYLVERIYREEGLTLHQRRKRRRRVAEHRWERFHPTGPNQVWSMDFVADQLADGRRFRSLTVVDIYTRECLAIRSEPRLKGEDVVRALNRIKVSRGVPKMVHCDNGSEFSSQAMDLWAYQNKVRMAFSRPGKPTDNAFVEAFNGTFSGRMPECALVHVIDGGPADRGDLAGGIQ
jgi:putative transposase